MKKWKVIIGNHANETREFFLDHDYETLEEAEREAETIADREFRIDDIGWSVNRHWSKKDWEKVAKAEGLTLKEFQQKLNKMKP